MQDKKLKVYYIIRARNAEATIYAALSSISRDCNTAVIVVVFDRCCDDTLGEVNRFSKDFDNTVLLMNAVPNGLGGGLITGLKAASDADYVFLLDADDENLKGRTANQITHMEANDIGICGTSINYFGSRSGECHYPQNDSDIRAVMKIVSPFANPSVCFSKSAVEKILRLNLFIEDLELFRKLAKDSDVRFGNLDNVYVKYRVHPNQATATGIANSREGISVIGLIIFCLFLISFRRKISLKLWVARRYFGLGRLKNVIFCNSHRGRP